jgi:hypothetical protein
MVAKTDFGEYDFITILASYDLGQYQEAEAISDGTVQSNFIIRTSCG